MSMPLHLLIAGLILQPGPVPRNVLRSEAAVQRANSGSRSRIAEVDGFRVAYEIRGSEQPALVLVQGWAGDRSHWHHQLGAFGGRQLVLLDLPGHGESDKPAITYSMDFLARAVHAVLDSARLDKAILVGHSNGVPVIRQVWRREPERVLALVAVDGAFRNPLRPEIARWMRQMATAPNFPEIYSTMVEQTPTGQLGAEDVRLIKQGALTTPAAVHVGGLDGLGDPSIWRDDPITVPMLVIYTDSPEWTEDYHAYVRRIAPTVEYHIWAGASHFLHMERPDAFNALVRTFIDRIAGG